MFTHFLGVNMRSCGFHKLAPTEQAPLSWLDQQCVPCRYQMIRYYEDFVPAVQELSARHQAGPYFDQFTGAIK